MRLQAFGSEYRTHELVRSNLLVELPDARLVEMVHSVSGLLPGGVVRVTDAEVIDGYFEKINARWKKADGDDDDEDDDNDGLERYHAALRADLVVLHLSASDRRTQSKIGIVHEFVANRLDRDQPIWVCIDSKKGWDAPRGPVGDDFAWRLQRQFARAYLVEKRAQCAAV